MYQKFDATTMAIVGIRIINGKRIAVAITHDDSVVLCERVSRKDLLRAATNAVTFAMDITDALNGASEDDTHLFTDPRFDLPTKGQLEYLTDLKNWSIQRAMFKAAEVIQSTITSGSGLGSTFIKPPYVKTKYPEEGK